MMKKILLLFAFFLSLSAYCQFPNPGIEGFENTSGPDLPLGNQTSPWTLGTGVPGNQWAVFDNGIGAGRWTINNTTVVFPTPPLVYQGANSAYINRVNANGVLTTENYLATPLVTIPANGQLRFWTRTFTNGNNGTFYDIKYTAANPGAAAQTNPAAYTNTLVTYTEDQLTLDPDGVQNAYNIYTQKIINFPAAMYGTQVYISFVRRNLQDDAINIDGDRWLLDAVQLNERCLDPTTLATGTILSTSANLTWANPSGATSWEIEVLPAATTATGVGFLYTGALPYTATTTSYGPLPLTQTPLTPNTCYKYYVRAVCPGSIASAWVGPFNFCTTTAPPVCGGNYVDPGGATANYGNNITAANGTTVICPTVPGQLVTVAFTSFATQLNLDQLRIYDGSVVTPTALLGTYSGNVLPPTFTSSSPDGCLTFVFTSNATVTGVGWVANVTCAPPPPCPRPTALVAVAPATPPGAPAVTPTSINLGWTSIAPATSWQYIVLSCTAPAPTAATTGWTATTSNPVLINTGILGGTCYNIYVRSDCTSSQNGLSDWSNPLNITTPVAPPQCGGNFVDSGGISGNYGNNENTTVTICGTNPGDIVTVTFTAFAVENGFDFLKVYDGLNATAPLLANLTGNVIPGPFTASSASGCLTFVFTSDGSVPAAGWLANITCVTPPPCPKPTALIPSGVTSNSATLTWTNVGPATSWQVIALACTAPAPNASTTNWIPVPGPATSYTFLNLSSATCYSLYVRADCSSSQNGVSTWAGPLPITTQVAPPVCGGNYVDSGGPTGNYANNVTAANGTTTICPTIPGQQVTVTFTSFATEANLDVLNVYNGSVATPTALLGTFSGNVAPGSFTSSAPDGCLTFVFTTDGSVTAAGWLANVTCAPPPTCAKPITLTAVVTGTTTATLSWVQPPNPGGGTATQWQVIVQLAGTGVPPPGATGTIVNGTPTFLATNLTPNTNYEFYVQAICSPTDSSPWGGPRPFFMASSCTSSQPFCGDTGLTYPNTTGQPSYGSIDCLFTTPNPAWYFMQVNQSGNLNFQIAQTNSGTGAGIDVDFVCWGPFTPAQYATLCNNLFDFPDGNTGIPDNVVACSYSAAPIENFIIPNAVSGNYYMVLITNFSNQTGTVTFNQTGGTGTTNCAIVCSVDVGPPSVTLCQGTPYTITATAQGATGYAWYFNNSPTPIPGQTTSTLVVTQSGIYRCTIACGANSSSDTITVNFTTPTVPTFNLPSTVCQGTTAPILPTSSSNQPTAITGTWSPATVNTSALGTTTYTFTPTTGQCASVFTFNIAIVPGSVVPTFASIPNICQGTPAPALPVASSDSPAITGTWSPATISTATVGTTTYTFTPSAGQCATTATLTVTIDAPSIVPTFAPIANICQGLPAPALPTQSTNQPNAITGSWNPATISTATVGTTTYTFTPSAGQCATTATLTVTIDAPSIVPTFAPIANICQGLPAPTLPTSSTNGTPITGTWNPSTINTSVVGPVVYTFTPAPNQCATQAQLTVTIDAPSILPTFNAIPNICQGLPAPALPTSSTNGTPITGTWNPATINTSVVGPVVYTFTPAPNQCATQAQLTVTIDAPSILPTFNAIPNICQGLPAPALPTSSTNGTPITGTWNPATINTSVVGPVVYTFTPAPNQCATQAQLTVTIVAPGIVPTFNQIASICQNGTAPALPTSSTNTTPITGTWSPSVINTAVAGTVMYTFTPNPSQCAVPTTMNITINAPTVATFTQIAAICQGGNAPALPTSSTNNPAITGTWSPSAINTTNPGTVVYTFTPTTGLCATGTTMSVTVHPTPVLAPVSNVNACDTYTLPTLSVGSYFSSPNGVGPITNTTLTTSQLVYVYAQSGTTPNCTDQDSFQVNITASPQFDIAGGCDNSAYVLEVINANFDTTTANYTWSGPNGTILNNNAPTLTVTTTGLYTCIVSVSNGTSNCTGQDTFDATANLINCEIPKGISPNGDGRNDTFDLSGFNVGKLNIFNRYGKSVYSRGDYVNEWGGQSDSGNELPDGTYYYIIERKDGGDTRTGWIYINRENR